MLLAVFLHVQPQWRVLCLLVPQRNHLQPAVLRVRLVVQHRLRPAASVLQPQQPPEPGADQTKLPDSLLQGWLKMITFMEVMEAIESLLYQYQHFIHFISHQIIGLEYIVLPIDQKRHYILLLRASLNLTLYILWSICDTFVILVLELDEVSSHLDSIHNKQDFG